MTSALSEAVERSRRAVESARALYRDGFLPECHAYFVIALRTLLRAWGPDDEPAFDALGRAGYRRIEPLRRAFAASAAVPPPPSHAPSEETLAAVDLPADHDAIWEEADALLRFTARRALTPAARKKRRIVLAVAAGVTLLLAGVVAARVWMRPRVIASAVLVTDFPAAFAVDGIEGTEWLLPDGATGWIDVLFSSPRTVRSVRLYNVHNRYWADRASQKVRVTAFNESRALGSVEGRFDGIKRDRSTLDLRLRAEGVTRIRAEVLSSFGLGGGFAEIEVR